MRNEPGLDAHLRERDLRALLGEAADAEHAARREHAHRLAQRFVAVLGDRALLVARELVERQVAAGLLEEKQRTVVGDEEAREERLGRAEALPRPAPEPLAADFGAMAIEAGDRTLGMFARGLADLRTNAEPVAHARDLAERNAGLRHAERPGVHADDEHLLRRRRVPSDIRGVR